MSDNLVTSPGLAGNGSGEVVTSRLADRLQALAPPSARDVAARSTEPAQAAESQVEAPPRGRPRSFTRIVVESFVSACSFVPYALVALTLRLVMARLLFLDGQTRIEGPRVPLTVQELDLSVVLPLQVKAETLTAFQTQIPPLPVPSAIAAYLVSYGEFVLPIFLVLGFATRFAALALLIVTTMVQIYVAPEALWTAHVYWASILLVLLAQGPGQISADHAIRFVARR